MKTIGLIGADVLSRCRVLNHFSFDNCTHIGDTSEGTPIEINAWCSAHADAWSVVRE